MKGDSNHWIPFSDCHQAVIATADIEREGSFPFPKEIKLFPNSIYLRWAALATSRR
jgi:hypothetical protein